MQSLGGDRPGHARGDIQGLRALAVLLVILNHAAGAPVGGFVGVDVFFVISGFLITGLLVREHDRVGRIDYADFYRRRVRRIVPMATVVLVVTVVATHLLFSAGRSRGVAVDAGWAFGFLANWHFAAVGTDYFAAAGPVSPLQHYWSLSVEEQFYVVWPSLMLGGLWIAGARGLSSRGRMWLLVGLASMVALGSFAYSLNHSSSDPVAAYFSTADRAWELAAGAVVALAAPLLTRTPGWLRPVLSWSGLVTIAASVMVVDERAVFPAPWAALPVVGSCLVIVAGIGARPRFTQPLDNPVSRYLGDISFSLYLWHFPVVVLALAFFPDAGPGYTVVVLGVTLVLSMLGYHLVEDPVRHSQWLEPRSRRLYHQGAIDHSARVANGWLVVGVAAAVGLSALTLRSPEPSPYVPVLAAGAEGSSIERARNGSAREQSAAEAYLQERIQQSLDFEDFPELNPPVDALGTMSWFSAAEAYGCISVTPPELDDCVFGNLDSESTAVVVGDSFGVAYMPALREALGQRFRVQQLTLQECPPFDAATTHFSGGAYPECSEFRRFATETVSEIDPDLVVVVSTYSYADKAMASGATGGKAFAEIEPGLERYVEQLSAPGRLVVILGPPPGAGNLQLCYSAVASPADCEKDIPRAWYDMTDLEKRVAVATGAQYVDARPLFCVNQFCPAFVGTTPVYSDGGHLTLEYAEQIGAALYQALRRAAQAWAAEESGARIPGLTGRVEK